MGSEHQSLKNVKNQLMDEANRKKTLKSVSRDQEEIFLGFWALVKSQIFL